MENGIISIELHLNYQSQLCTKQERGVVEDIIYGKPTHDISSFITLKDTLEGINDEGHINDITS